MKNNVNALTIFISVILILFVTTFVVFFINNNSYLKSNINIKNENNNINENNSINENNIISGTSLEEIASYTTKIYDKDENRIHNIKLACKNLNNTKVELNEEFSFNSKLGNMGKAEGYKKSIGFDNYGNEIQVYGGGICQISSTLYNCLLIAKLDVTERHAHSRRVYYVPKDKDATVFAGGPDLKFINNLNYPIIIKSSTDGYTVTVSLLREKIIEKQISSQ